MTTGVDDVAGANALDSETVDSEHSRDENSQNSAHTDRVRVLAALARFRVSAYVTGIGLLGLCVVMVLRYGFDNAEPSAIYSPFHGVLYMIYVVLTIDLAIKARFAIKNTLLVLIAGCIPFVSFFVERWVSRQVKSGAKL